MIVFVTNVDRTEPSTCPDERLQKLPVSAKLVYYVLAQEGQLTQSDLAERAILSVRTTRAALSTLTEAGLVAEKPCVRDARKKLYRTKEPNQSLAASGPE